MARSPAPPAAPRGAAHSQVAAPPAAPRRGVSRSLFKSHLTRRPTPTGTATSSSNGSAETLRLPDVDIHSDSTELVVRDKHGEIEIGDLPMGVLDDGEEGMHDIEESKVERQRLAEAVKQHQVNHSTIPEQPEELLEAVRKSLRAKVAALDEDQWMYEDGDACLRR
ncbi:predicted protein [Verticillium alfalfae VaMs.102]|uniref:Predicted protein n=1 Tax=Verticillium alfalfae (strain VaMs.102 / ATCC MYA-4576 / FGSC 10136) TaxID=526221 RepID=C9S8W7_VERA1|nr:predicted protein [Verticillium alfalfae VaMs.102]EEY14044.1 predicted protein [Verticillium alfalfae VaMs.102]